MSAALFEYPITELKNVAKQYNLAYYIDNIERLTKSQLIDSILDHMKWKKAQSELENTVDVTLPLAPIKTNYEKVRDKTKPRIRKNYAELRAETEKRKPAHQPIPKYKGRKDWSKIKVEALEPQVYEVVMDGKIPTVFEFVNTFHNLDPADQTKIVNTLGMTEAQALPEGVEAFGDLTEAEEKEVAETVIEAVKEAKNEIVENVREAKTVLEEYKSKLKPREKKAYYPDMEKWRLVRIAELLIEKPSLSQSQIGKLLEKDGFTVGTAQSSVSKQLGEIKKLNLIPKNAPKPPAVAPVVKEEPKPEPKPEPKKEEPKANTKLEKLEALKKEGYKYEPPAGMSRAEALKGLNDLWEKAYDFVTQAEEDNPKKTNRYYTADGDLSDRMEKDGDYVRRKAQELNYIPDRRFAYFSLGETHTSWSMSDSREEIDKKWQIRKQKEHDFVNILGNLVDGDEKTKLFYDEDLMEEEIKRAKRTGGLIFNPLDIVKTPANKGFLLKYGDKDTFNTPAKLMEPTVADFTKKIKICEDLAHVLENISPVEALGWRVIYQELWEARKNLVFPKDPKDVIRMAPARQVTPASADPVVLSSLAAPGESPDVTKNQKKHGEHLEMMFLKALSGLSPITIGNKGKDASHYPIVDMTARWDAIKDALKKNTDSLKSWTELQHAPKEWIDKSKLQY
jgi:hypothetical protein